VPASRAKRAGVDAFKALLAEASVQNELARLGMKVEHASA